MKKTGLITSMSYKRKSFAAFAAALAFSMGASAGNLSNFNEPNTAKFIQALNSRSVHVVQLGDSHTAADVWTETVREQLQNALGNGGMGWGMPMYFAGQRLAEYGYDNSGWVPVSSRTERNQNYALGGLIAVPRYSGATLTIKPKQSEQEQAVTVSLRQAAGDGDFTGVDASGKSFSFGARVKDGTWQTAQFNARLPFTITAHGAQDSAIGGWWAKNASGAGAVVSALGINGAELGYWNHWSNGWKKELGAIAPDLIVLAYGTNEAYGNPNIEQAKKLLSAKIQEIRQASPGSAVMIVSAPESLKSTAGQCGRRPDKLTEFQEMQAEVAQQQRAMLWNWQQAMGGACSMKSWISRGEARGDGVHFTASGYQKLGRMLAADLLDLAGNPAGAMRSNPSSGQNSGAAQQPVSSSRALGYGEICEEGGKNCRTFRF